MIIIRTNHDVPTSYLHKGTEAIISEAEKQGFNVSRLEGDAITLKNLRSRKRKLKSRFIFFNGHGTSRSLFDNHGNAWLDIGSADVFSGTVAFCRACHCLKELGPEAVKQGCSAFVGYRKQFWIARVHRRECTPLKDKVAKPIIECSNIIPYELMKGNTVEEAIDKSHERSAEHILELIYSKEPLAAATLAAIIQNDSVLGVEGDFSATIC